MIPKFPSIQNSKGTTKNEVPMDVLYFEIDVTLQEDTLDLENRRVVVSIYVRIHFDYNTSFNTIWIPLTGTDELNFYLNKTSASATNCWFSGVGYPHAYLSGPAELFPFDMYSVNVTMRFGGSVSTEEELDLVDLDSWLRGWEVIYANYGVTQDNGVNFAFTIRRELWQGIPFLVPVLIGFVALGFSSIINIKDEGGQGRRIEIYVALLIWAVGFSFFSTPMVPSSAQYLSVAELLGFALAASVISFLVFTILGSEFKKGSKAWDLFAIITSFGFTAILLDSVWAYSYNWLLPAQHIINLMVLGFTIILSSGLLIRSFETLFQKYQENGVDSLKIRNQTFHEHSWSLYWGFFLMNMMCLGITLYWVIILGPTVEMTPLRRFLFELTFSNHWLMLFINIVVSIALILPLYYLPNIVERRNASPQAKRDSLRFANFFGLLLFLFSIFNLLNDTQILILVNPWLLVPVYLGCAIASYLILRIFVYPEHNPPNT
jgi:hypothetical protein